MQTLLDGITIGDHRLSDEQQVLRIKEGWNLLFEKAKKDNIVIGKELFNLTLLLREPILVKSHQVEDYTVLINRWRI